MATDCDQSAVYLLPRKLMRLSGSEKLKFLQGLMTRDVNQLDNNQSIYSAFLSAQGKVQADIFLINYDQDILLDYHAKQEDFLYNYLRRFILRADVKIEIANEWQVYATFDESKTIKNHKDIITIVDPRTAEIGWRMYAKNSPSLSTTTDNTLYNYKRIITGIPDTEDMVNLETIPNTPTGFPLEFGLDKLNAVSWNKGCYIGQEVTAYSKRGGIKRQFLPVLINGSLPNFAEKIFLFDDQDANLNIVVGEMRTAAKNYGLAIIRLDAVSHLQLNKSSFLKCGNSHLSLSDILFNPCS